MLFICKEVIININKMCNEIVQSIIVRNYNNLQSQKNNMST